MRMFYWILALAGLVLLLLGALDDAPEFINVMGDTVEQWYTDQGTWAMIIGAVIGVISAAIATQVIRHHPHEPSTRYASRVGMWGLVTLVVAAIAVIGMGLSAAQRFSMLPIAPEERVLELLLTAKFAGVVGAGVLACGLLFAIVARFVHWGGRYALLTPGWMPSTTSAQK